MSAPDTPNYVNHYYDTDRISRAIEIGNHRVSVGGFWDQLGPMQLAYLCARGLTPQMRLLDIGCGCLRGGVHFVDYLEPNRYFGTDLSQDLMDVGYDVELAKLGLTHKLPRSHLLCSDNFDFSAFEAPFDMALAQSVFTHLTLNHFRLCLENLAPVMGQGGQFFVTVFHSADADQWRHPQTHMPGEVVSYPDRDPYHYSDGQMHQLCEGLPWAASPIVDWGHPRAQKMTVFTRR